VGDGIGLYRQAAKHEYGGESDASFHDSFHQLGWLAGHDGTA
jgi:hypothetical protein